MKTQKLMKIECERQKSWLYEETRTLQLNVTMLDVRSVVQRRSSIKKKGDEKTQPKIF